MEKQINSAFKTIMSVPKHFHCQYCDKCFTRNGNLELHKVLVYWFREQGSHFSFFFLVRMILCRPENSDNLFSSNLLKMLKSSVLNLK